MGAFEGSDKTGERSKGRVVCVGLGPGDPELLTLRAHRLVSKARIVAYFRKKGRPGLARRMVEGMLAPGVEELAMEYPVTTEIPFEDPAYNGTLAPFYAEWAGRLKARAEAGEEVVVLCEGDPFLYGSFMHLQARLPAEMVEVVPGVTGMSGCWTASGQPIAWGDDVLTVMPATLSEAEMAQRIAHSDALVVMKIGRNLPRLRRALTAAGRLEAAWLVERGTMEGQRIRRMTEIPEDEEAPYFAILLLHGQGRRP
ncbi:precorrin-2 C(20)-methyltransferase [Neomegalonema sp.]|uniref:precorrin-2 C(20)-methyltransferase n=1 Tax=Neomegalonema sp. TaxID=2039713 RepID=UPI00260E4AD5|nr:precorrin-2 C(20)-methyltransferase [Neomegalonema sp.]MDD2868392.1 precorrin-2 C(20)-methyltransferase [Neomegalonema sp.]